MSFQHEPFMIANVQHKEMELRLELNALVAEVHPSLSAGKCVYLSTEPPKATPRTSDMQDLVDRCEAKAAPGQGWRKVHEADGSCTRIMDGSRMVCMVTASWLLDGKTAQEREAELRQRREAYFRNVPLLVNAQRMFDLLCRLRDDKCVFNNGLEEELVHLIRQIKTQQWNPENPKG